MFDIFTEFLLVLVVLCNMVLLGSSRLGMAIRVTAVQGFTLGLLLLFGHGAHLQMSLIFTVVATMVLKAGVLPWLLFRAVRETGSRREIQPFIGFNTSLFAGIIAWVLSVWLGRRLPLPTAGFSDLLVPVALCTTFVGLFLIVSRRHAITQVLGYLVLENGICVFGVAAQAVQPLLVELGMLLDVFVAVFVMVITLFQINREIGEIAMDTSKLAALKD